MTLTRQYIPAIGKSVKMRLFSDYTSRNLHPWSWLRVHSLNSEGAVVHVLNGNKPTGEVLTIPLTVIDPPIGWEPQYTIYVLPDKVEQVLSWFTRGIVVRANHEIGSSMGSTFQPMDNASQPHWRYPEVTDAIPAADCAKVFRIVKYEREEIDHKVFKAFEPTCVHCHGTGRRTLAELTEIRKESIESLRAKLADLHLNKYDSETETFECYCHWGSFRRLCRSKRAKVIKEWKQQGWEVTFHNHGEHSYWERTRETIVKDWE